MRRLGLIGAGSLARTVLATLKDHLRSPLDFISILVAGHVEERRRAIEPFAPAARTLALRMDFIDFLADRPEFVVECAGHAAVRQYGVKILENGSDLALASIGALADDDLRQALAEAARMGGARLIVTAGALGGVDVLGAAQLSGLRSVMYTARKPPRAWTGTAAAALLDLEAIREPVAFFEGTARQAARDYPQNANVAATLAIAGLGFDETRVRLVADPRIDRNKHEVSVESACVNFRIEIEGVASPDNPKTSLTAGFSLAREVLSRTAERII